MRTVRLNIIYKKFCIKAFAHQPAIEIGKGDHYRINGAILYLLR